MSSAGQLSEQQLQLFFLLQSMVLSFKPDGLAQLTDSDVALAAGALAHSLETASRGLIFEEAAASVPAESLRRAFKPVVEEITKGGGPHSARDVAIVLRGMERGARHEGWGPTDSDTSYLELVGRVFQQRRLQPRPLIREQDTPLILMP